MALLELVFLLLSPILTIPGEAGAVLLKGS